MDHETEHDAQMIAFVDRYQTLQFNLSESGRLFQELIVYAGKTDAALRSENEHLIELLNELRDDIDADRERKLKLQAAVADAEYRVHILEQENIFMKDNNPYVVILIDGDGLLFKDSFTSQDREGGENAAYALRAAILKECNEHAKDTEVVATIFANQAGLAKALYRDGAIKDESDLADFMLGFTQGKAMFTFKDVGPGKEKEIEDTIKWHLRNINCKQVILGISHDDSYAPFITELFHGDENTRHRVSIVEGFPTKRDLVKTGARILDFNETVFRKNKLTVQNREIPAESKGLAESTPRNSTPTSRGVSPGVIGSGILGNGSSATNSGSSDDRIPTPTTSTSNNSPLLPARLPAPLPAPLPSAPSTPVAPPATTWARAIANASPPPQITLPIQPRPVTSTRPSQHIIAAQQAAAAAKATQVAWNPGRRGLDPPIQVSQMALDNIKKRKDSHKLCNNHYLRGPCAKGDSCCFEHKYKPTKDELNAIAFLTRLNPCAMGQECDIEDCIYGHHCPSVRDGYCTHPFCKFEKNDHPPGTKFKARLNT